MRNLGSFPQGKPAATVPRYQTLINYKVHAGSFRVSVIHRTLTWTCVRDSSYMYKVAGGLIPAAVPSDDFLAPLQTKSQIRPPKI